MSDQRETVQEAVESKRRSAGLTARESVLLPSLTLCPTITGGPGSSCWLIYLQLPAAAVTLAEGCTHLSLPELDEYQVRIYRCSLKHRRSLIYDTFPMRCQHLDQCMHILNPPIIMTNIIMDYSHHGGWIIPILLFAFGTFADRVSAIYAGAAGSWNGLPDCCVQVCFLHVEHQDNRFDAVLHSLSGSRQFFPAWWSCRSGFGPVSTAVTETFSSGSLSCK